jgi:hypothetical protein
MTAKSAIKTTTTTATTTIHDLKMRDEREKREKVL